MNKFRFSVKTQLALSFGVIVVLYLSIYSYSFLSLRDSKENTTAMTETYYPTVVKAFAFKLLMADSKSMAKTWRAIDVDHVDKQNLIVLHGTGYPDLKEELVDLVKSWPDTSVTAQFDSVFVLADSIISYESQLRVQLATVENYEGVNSMSDFALMMKVDDLMSFINRDHKLFDEKLSKLLVDIQNRADKSGVNIKDSSNSLITTSTILAVVLVLVCIVIAILMNRLVVNPVNKVKNILVDLSKGKVSDDSFTSLRNDEIGDMLNATEELTNGLKKTSSFAGEIGSGNLEAGFEPLSEEDVLGNSLLSMRSNLVKAEDEDQRRQEADDRRNWATVGQAKFAEILRNDNDNLEVLSYNIISNLVSYSGANQGGIFVIDETDEGQLLKLQAAYAYDRKKFMEKELHQGEGLVGQCWLEGEKIFLTEVPQGYMEITSGLGDASPDCILIVPLKVNNQIYGVIEIASFEVFKEHEVDFIEKISESIAVTISNVQVSVRTAKLLQDSQQLGEQLRAQEEELRQNTEEMLATQEEMGRKIGDLEQIVKDKDDQITSLNSKK